MELLKKIEEEGERKLRKILAETEEEAKRQLSQADQEIQAARAEQLKQAQAEIESEKRLVTSRARAQAREVVLRAKGLAAERLFADLTQEAASFRNDKRVYKAFLARCLKESEGQIEGGLLLEIAPHDEDIVKEVIKETQHKIGRKIKTIGGFVATNKKGDLLIDNRLETRIANLRQEHRAELSSDLFG
ncbi:hypothetical protein HY229_05790 [Candidatus Acetothermia bacterium]|nr:hypothetical protein [Candidatus Acetothermia bacterium]MBI3643594.1 hypothetical protein [Candidatus Acetothermia bacterium]